MIIQLKSDLSAAEAEAFAKGAKGFLVNERDARFVITSSGRKDLDGLDESSIEDHWVFATDIQLGSRSFLSDTREIKLGDVRIGGNTDNTIMITGPCSVESEEQIEQCAQLCVEQGVKILRAGSFKPRTSPYSFQGMALEGLKLLAAMREKYGLLVITEVRDATQVDDIIEYSDIVQIGAKAMYDQGILRRCAEIRKPVLLKRGFGTTLQEFAQAAEFILSGGNLDVMLCERGIRTFETKTRFTLDLCGVAWLKEHLNLPIILDPSHAMGYRYGVPDLTRACMAMGVDGLLIETHPDPDNAFSDAAQQLNFDQFRSMYKTLGPVAKSIGRNLI